MDRLVKLDRMLGAACGFVAMAALATGILVVMAEWMFRQATNQNLLHEVLEPATWSLAAGSFAAVAALRVGPGARGSWVVAAAVLGLAAVLVAGAATLDLGAARSAFHPAWSLRTPAFALAFFGAIASLRFTIQILNRITSNAV